jgi:hypothetical protein
MVGDVQNKLHLQYVTSLFLHHYIISVKAHTDWCHIMVGIDQKILQNLQNKGVSLAL